MGFHSSLNRHHRHLWLRDLPHFLSGLRWKRLRERSQRERNTEVRVWKPQCPPQSPKAMHSSYPLLTLQQVPGPQWPRRGPLSLIVSLLQWTLCQQPDLSEGISVCLEEVADSFPEKYNHSGQPSNKHLTQRQGQDRSVSVCWAQGWGLHFLMVGKQED